MQNDSKEGMRGAKLELDEENSNSQTKAFTVFGKNIQGEYLLAIWSNMSLKLLNYLMVTKLDSIGR